MARQARLCSRLVRIHSDRDCYAHRSMATSDLQNHGLGCGAVMRLMGNIDTPASQP
jgi:hypothetical protein